jgi:hypothetical protein
MSSNQLIRIETNITAPPTCKIFLRPIFLLINSKMLQMDLDNRFEIKPAPRTDKEVLIKSAAVTSRRMTPKKNIK